jgi:hypothetical protein
MPKWKADVISDGRVVSTKIFDFRSEVFDWAITQLGPTNLMSVQITEIEEFICVSYGTSETLQQAKIFFIGEK